MHTRSARSRSLSTIVTAVVLTTAAPAFVMAQESTSAGPVLEQIIVTAQKREENLQTVPFSVSAVTGESLERFQYQDLKNLNGLVPNVQFTQMSNVGLTLAPSIRGIGITNNPDPYTGTEVAVVIDGVVQGTRLLGLSDQFDIERIEVLRGPQGTLFGANTLGGVVNIVSRQPTGELGAYGKLTVGNYNERNAALAVNFPIVQDVLAGKVSLSQRQRDGFYTNLFDGSDLMWIDSAKARGHLLFTPSEDLSATLIIGRDRVRNGADIAANISSPNELFWRPGITQEVNFNQFSDSPHINRADLDTYTLNVDWTTAIGQVTAIANYMDFDAFNIQDVDATQEFLMNAGRDLASRQHSAELRLATDFGDNVELTLGAFFMDLHYDVNTMSMVHAFSPDIITEQDVVSDEQSTALFAQLYWDMTDKLRLGAGFRMTQIDIDLGSVNRTHRNANLHPYYYSRNIAEATLIGSFAANGSEEWTEPGGKLSIDYQITSDVMLYAYYARGFKSGGFNGRITDPRDIGPFQPEYIDTIEVGMRSDWFNRRLRANVGIFYSEWDDMQVPQSVFRGDPPVASSTILNAASATSQGVELELEALPLEDLTISASIGYLDAKYEEFVDAGVDYSGRPTPYAPEWTASLTASYDLDIGAGTLTPSVQYSFNDERWAAFTQFPAEHLDSYNLVNANLMFAPANSSWKVALWATNLTDEEYLSSSLTVPPLFSFASFGAPRQYGIDVTFDF
jgi:iron complex outermembrane recepter protein